MVTDARRISIGDSAGGSPPPGPSVYLPGEVSEARGTQKEKQSARGIVSWPGRNAHYSWRFLAGTLPRAREKVPSWSRSVSTTVPGRFRKYRPDVHDRFGILFTGDGKDSGNEKKKILGFTGLQSGREEIL